MSLKLDELAWTVAEGETEDYVFQIRFRHFPENLVTTEYPHRLNIFWKMSEILDNGFPDKTELDKLHTFEDRLIDAVEFDEFSIMSMVLTGDGQREFVFHTPDPPEFIKRLIDMPQEEEKYPIEIHSNEDKEWYYYFNELNNIE